MYISRNIFLTTIASTIGFIISAISNLTLFTFIQILGRICRDSISRRKKMTGCGISKYSICICNFDNGGEEGSQIDKFNSLDIAIKIMKTILKCSDFE